MDQYPIRKPNRIKNYDYATPGAYFITVCTANREKLFWNGVGADIIRPETMPLSTIGKTVEQGILQIADHYKMWLLTNIALCPTTYI